jgi:hypothetical protein
MPRRTQYPCPRCGKTYVLSADYKKHLERMRPCKPILADISLEDEKIKMQRQHTRKKRNTPTTTQTDPPAAQEPQQETKTSHNYTHCTFVTTHTTPSPKPSLFVAPDARYISDTCCKRVLRDLDQRAASIVRRIYFNPRYPHNRSIRDNTRDLSKEASHSYLVRDVLGRDIATNRRRVGWRSCGRDELLVECIRQVLELVYEARQSLPTGHPAGERFDYYNDLAWSPMQEHHALLTGSPLASSIDAMLANPAVQRVLATP